MLSAMARARAAIGTSALALLTALLACAADVVPPTSAPEPAQTADHGWRALSETGRLAGHLEPESGAVEIGKFQTWIVELRAPGGAAVKGAELAIAGGMPGHGHGLPTQPRVTEELGEGRYRIEGVKLNMVGAWVIEVYVSTPAMRERLRFDLAIDY
jgi:hypothetical protein